MLLLVMMRKWIKAKKTWRIPYTMTKENVCFDNKLLSWTNMNKRWTSKTNFFFTWFTQELDYKVKCTALTGLKIISKSWLLKSWSSLLWHLIWKQKTLIQLKFIYHIYLIITLLLLQMNIRNGLHFNSLRFSCSSLLDRWKIPGGAGKGEATQHSFIQGHSTPRYHPLTICKWLLTKTVPLSN